MPQPTVIYYQSPPGSGGNDGALPTTYDPLWQYYVNLTQEQIAAFQAFPEDLVKYTAHRRWQWEISATSSDGLGPAQHYLTIPADGTAIAGMQVYADDRSQNKISYLFQGTTSGAFTHGPAGTTPFLARNGTYWLAHADITALYGYVMRWIQQSYVTAANLYDQINVSPPTVTSRAQVDAAFQAEMIVQ